MHYELKNKKVQDALIALGILAELWQDTKNSEDVLTVIRYIHELENKGLQFAPKDFPVSIGDGKYLVVVSTDTCPICKNHFWNEKLSVPRSRLLAGLRNKSHFTYNGEVICEQCAAEGKAGFTCGVCGEERTSDQEHDTFYEEYRCIVCYETKTAKEWEALEDSIREAHRYDYD